MTFQPQCTVPTSNALPLMLVRCSRTHILTHSLSDIVSECIRTREYSCVFVLYVRARVTHRVVATRAFFAGCTTARSVANSCAHHREPSAISVVPYIVPHMLHTECTSRVFVIAPTVFRRSSTTQRRAQHRHIFALLC